MNCPVCSKPMEAGYLSAGGYRIKWTPRMRSFTNLTFSTEEVLLQTTSLTGKNQIRAHLCRSCRKIIADY